MIVGVHTPEFAVRAEPDNVADAIDENGLAYPVVQDNDYGTWDAFANQFWPAKYLIDAEGHVRYAHFGEGAVRDDRERDPQPPRRGRGASLGERSAREGRRDGRPGVRTPETYLGWRARRGIRPTAAAAGRPRPRRRPPATPPTNGFAFDGALARSTASRRRRCEDAGIRLGFQARRVFLVLGSEGGPGQVRGAARRRADRPTPHAGEDVAAASRRSTDQRLYRLVDLTRPGSTRSSSASSPASRATRSRSASRAWRRRGPHAPVEPPPASPHPAGGASAPPGRRRECAEAHKCDRSHAPSVGEAGGPPRPARQGQPGRRALRSRL